MPSGKGQGEPFKLEPFQKLFIRAVYEPQLKLRRVVRRAILSMARKNGKTALIAAIVLAHLVGPEAIVHGEIYSAANDRDQAAIVYKFARQMVDLDPELGQMIELVPSTKTMIARRTGSVYRAISAEAGTKHGYLPSLVIYDELAQAKNRDLYDVLDTSFGARDDTGERGEIGPMGERGERGEQGPQGERGDNGERGQDGKQGEKGEAGEQGQSGPAGDQGVPGEKGETGERGEKGEAGEQGQPGPAGDQGVPGEKGETGERGEKGEAGEQGQSGPAGDQGVPGEKGETGERGEKGEAGEQGQSGPAGDQGVPGEKGETGERGEKGEAGEQGQSGPAGDQGVPGEKGETGERGEAGPPGEKGAPGQLKTARAYEDGSVHYDGDLVLHQGSTYQARCDTAKAPPHEDWQLIAAKGRDAVMPKILGTYREGENYSFLNIVALGGSSFIARSDDPGPCPGEGWQLIASAGRPGKQGPPGARGEAGARGERGLPAPSIIGWTIDREAYTATPILSDTSEAAPLQLRELFVQFQDEAS
ncbi:terminase large subunit [Bradyrhizobium septentrionale]|nr:terminase large subunit [Bradyrhizobium septentrionale]UGY16366.1 terminase large subunit [Bradyrhizobium septentrionale]